jgi:DNA modification methylase
MKDNYKHGVVRDCFELLRSLENDSVQLILTNPPYAETVKKELEK